MASKNIRWVVVNPSTGTGPGTVSVSGPAYEGRGLRSQTIWFNPTNSTEVESVQFNVRQLAKGISFTNFMQGTSTVTLNSSKTASKTIAQDGTSLSYSFKTNAKSVYIQLHNIDGTGNALQITSVKINNVSVNSSTANASSTLIIHSPTGDPGKSESYTVQFTASIGANTGTVDRKIVLFIAGADDDTDPVKFQVAYSEYRASINKECFANINITQKYTAPSVTITGTGVVKGDDGVYTTNSIPVDGTPQTFTIQASDNLEWSIDDARRTPSIGGVDFDDIGNLS